MLVIYLLFHVVSTYNLFSLIYTPIECFCSLYFKRCDPLGSHALSMCPHPPCWGWSEFICRCPQPSRILSEGETIFHHPQFYVLSTSLLLFFLPSPPPYLCGHTGTCLMGLPIPLETRRQKLERVEPEMLNGELRGIESACSFIQGQNLQTPSQSSVPPLLQQPLSLCPFPTLKISVTMLLKGGRGETHQLAKLENEHSELRLRDFQ